MCAQHYRVDYATASPRTFCTKCLQPLRSGDLRFMAFQSFRHIDCVESIEVLKLWQHCKSFNSVPGFSSLEASDRTQVQALFKTLLLSTPAHAQGMMRAKLLAAAAAASLPTQPTLACHVPYSFDHSNAPQRQPSNDDMMTESCSPPASNHAMSGMSTSPDLLPQHMAIVPTFGTLLPPHQPVLSSTPSALAHHMSALSCSTPTHSVSPVPQFNYLPGSGSGQHAQTHHAHSPSFSLAHRPLFRDVSGSSSTSSPGMQPRALYGHPGGTDRSVSPHSNHSSPIPFAAPHVPLRPFNSPLASSTPLAQRVAKRKLESCIPEEDVPASPLLSHTFAPVANADDSMMCDDDEANTHSSKKRRTVIRPEAR